MLCDISLSDDSIYIPSISRPYTNAYAMHYHVKNRHCNQIDQTSCCISVIQTEDPSNLVKSLLYSSFNGNEATRYGHDMEAKIEKDVILKYPGIKIEHPSLTADKKHKFLAGSPDGIANLNNENF